MTTRAVAREIIAASKLRGVEADWTHLLDAIDAALQARERATWWAA